MNSLTKIAEKCYGEFQFYMGTGNAKHSFYRFYPQFCHFSFISSVDYTHKFDWCVQKIDSSRTPIQPENEQYNLTRLQAEVTLVVKICSLLEIVKTTDSVFCIMSFASCILMVL